MKPNQSKQPPRYVTTNPRIDALIKNIIDECGHIPNADLLREMIVTAVKLHDDGMDRGDIKMMTIALKELRYALKIFYPYQHVRKVAIFGSARIKEGAKEYNLARDFSRRIAENGWMVVTGAASGIMSAGNEGAGRENSFGVNIRLPLEQKPNLIIADDPKLVNFKYFFTRKLIFIRESDATVLFPGGFGTHDEGFETLTLVQTGKATPRPIVCLDSPKCTYWKAWREFIKKQLGERGLIDKDDLGMIHFTHDAEDAVKMITHFYRNYHSSRYIGDRLVFRIKKPLSKSCLRELNRNFKSILAKGKIEQFDKPFNEEVNEPHTSDLIRLAMYFNRRHFACLRRLIDRINNA